MMRISAISLSAALLALCLAGPALAQQIKLSGLKQDHSAPVEVTSDTLDVDQTNAKATFTGDVLIVQGTMRLSAAKVEVNYVPGDTRKIDSMHATGGVTLVTETEAAKGDEATYRPEQGSVVMTGNVLLTQGDNSVAGQKLTIDLNSGTGQMSGRVTTVLIPSSTDPKPDAAKPAPANPGKTAP